MLVYIFVLQISTMNIYGYSQVFELFTHLVLIVSMKTQTDNYIIYNDVILDYYEIFELFTHVMLICVYGN